MEGSLNTFLQNSLSGVWPIFHVCKLSPTPSLVPSNIQHAIAVLFTSRWSRSCQLELIVLTQPS